MVEVYGRLVQRGKYILDPIEGDTRKVVPEKLREQVREWLKNN